MMTTVAMAVTGGLITSTALSLSLIFVPVVYEIVESIEHWIARKATRLVTPRKPGDDDPIPMAPT
ncbi:hypothetical protein ACWGM0_14600 [Sphingomonas bisphenolicum]